MRLALSSALAAGLLATPALAQNAPPVDYLSSIKPDFAAAISNIPGKSVKTVLVTYGPGKGSPAHTHAKSAFIVAYVLEGSITSSVNGEPPKTFAAGQYWTEKPGDHHGVSANASKTDPAKLLAIFVVDTDDGPLTKGDGH